MNRLPKRIFIYIIAFSAWPMCGVSQPAIPQVKTGAEVLLEDYLVELESLRVGLVMNPTARIGGTHMLDTLIAAGVNVTALYAPEHGFRGDAGAGEIIKDGVDQQTGLPVYSLYSASKKPGPEMLEAVDILLFDMQDVGARFYTYNSTMKYVIEAAAENNKQVWILDRPNPAGGNYVAGWVLENEYESFIGSYPIPVAHGLTLGELALMAVGEDWLNIESDPVMKVIAMEGWKREMKWPDTGLPWIAPSPNLPSFTHSFVYLGTCFFEGTTMSEGRGTDNPFLTIGSPTLNPDLKSIIDLSVKYSVSIDTISFIPESIPGKALNPKHMNEKLKGVSISPETGFTNPVEFGIELLHELMSQDPEASYTDFIYMLSGTKEILNAKKPTDWGAALEKFKMVRKKYLIYD